MEFKLVSRLSTLLSKSFAEEFLKLLLIYKDISASEAASRLDLHIKTAQDFLEELYALDIAGKKEVFERKRPYFRYSLKKKKLNIEIDFSALYDPQEEKNKLKLKIRERKNSGAIFTTASNNQFLSTVTIVTGEGRKRKQRKISLTTAQGKFLYHLPFPNGAPLSIEKIIKKAEIDESYYPEIMDIVEVLKEYDVIE